MAAEFVAIGIVERDTREDVLWSWVYPSISLETRSVIQRRLDMAWNSPASLPFSCGQFKHLWHYSYSEEVSLEKLPKVTLTGIVLLASDFNPEKYNSLSQVLMKQYKKDCNPAVLLESYLMVFTKGVCRPDENGTFRIDEHDGVQALANSKVKDIVNMFGLETILIYTALLLKKRIIVYHPQMDVLATICWALPAFVWHRQNWNIVFPFVNVIDDELSDLRQTSAYVAGFTDNSIENRSDLYDIFVNAYSKEITVASHAKETFSMGKLHKELATFIVESAEQDDVTDLQFIKEMSRKTKELIGNLKSLSTEEERGRPVISEESFREKKLPATTKSFLLGIAAAEGMLKTF